MKTPSRFFADFIWTLGGWGHRRGYVTKDYEWYVWKPARALGRPIARLCNWQGNRNYRKLGAHA